MEKVSIKNLKYNSNLQIYLFTFYSSGDSLFEHDTSTQRGIKLKFLEDDLAQQTQTNVEKACKENGLLSTGSKSDMIRRLLILEDFKIKTENLNDLDGEAIDLSNFSKFQLEKNFVRL